MEALSKISDIISQLKKKKEEDDEDVDISDLEIIFMKILNVLKTGIEEEKARFATERMFQEEKQYEDEKRHEEFLSVLKQFVSMQPLQRIEEEEKSSGILNFFKNLIETLKNFFKGFLLPKLLKIFGVLKNVFMKTIEIVGKLIKKIGSLMLRIMKFIKQLNWGKLFLRLGRIFLTLVRFGGPIGLLVGSIVGLSYLFGELVKKVPNMSALKPDQAIQLLKEYDDTQLEKYLKDQPLAIPEKYMKMPGTARQKIEAFVNETKTQRLEELSKKEGTGTLSTTEQKELEELKKPITIPSGVVMPEREKIEPRPPFEGQGARWNSWNQKYFKNYNPDGTRREKPTDEPIPTTRDELKRRREEELNAQQQTATPVRTDTSFTELNQKKQEINQISQILTERLNELNSSKNSLEESKLSTKSSRERYQINEKIRLVDEEITKTRKQINDLQRGIIPAGISRTTVLPQTNTSEEIVSSPLAPAERAQPMALTGLPAELLQPSSVTGEPGATGVSETRETVTATQMPMSEEIDLETVEPTASPMTPETMNMNEPIQESVEPKISAPVQEPNRVTNLFNTVNQENRMLELARTMSTNQMGESGTIVNNVGKTEIIPDVPLSVEASQRDDTHTLSIVLSRYKRAYV